MTTAALLCLTCDKSIQEGIFNNDFIPDFLKVLLPLVILVPLLLIYFNSLNNKSSNGAKRTPVVIFSLLIGIGMGGFVDGIVLHQLLQWHQMLSNKIIPDTLQTKSINMFWDGVFEGTTWIFTLVGIILMWHSRKRTDLHLSNNLFIGGMIAGWGVFNLMDSIMNHYIFKFHNVRENVPEPNHWNLGFLMLSLGMILLGWLWIRNKNW